MLYFVKRAAGILSMNTYPISCYHSICVTNEVEIIFIMSSYVNIRVFLVDIRYAFLYKYRKFFNNIIRCLIQGLFVT